MFPIFEGFIMREDDGISYVSLVDVPAIESDFVAFKKDEPVKFSVQNEEQRIVFGPLMRANYPIYRNDSEIGEYYIRYSRETIKKIAEKLMQDSRQNSINLMHSDVIDGVTMIEMFLKDTEKGINPKGFEEIEDGSLFAAYKVNNDEVWNSIKCGEFKGFSIEGFFSFVRQENYKKMSIKGKLINAVVKFGEVSTDKGLIYWVGDEDLKEGDEVFHGEDKAPLADGEYTTQDEKVIKVVDGKVTEILDPKAEVDSNVEMSAEVEEVKQEEIIEEVKQEEEVQEEVTIEETPDYMLKADYDALKADFDGIKAENEQLKLVVDELKKAIEDINSKLSLPAEKPIEEQFDVVKKSEKKLGNAARILSHLKD